MFTFHVACRVCVHVECNANMIWPKLTYKYNLYSSRKALGFELYLIFYTSNNVSTLVILQVFAVNQIADTATLKRAVRDLDHKLITLISILKRIQFYFKMLPNNSGNLGAHLAKLSGTKSAP